MPMLDNQLGPQMAQPQSPVAQQPMAAPQQQQRVNPEDDKKSLQQDAVNFSLMLKDMTPEERAQAYPGMVKNIQDRNPELGAQLDPNKPPSDEQLAQLIPDELKDIRTMPKSGAAKLSELFGKKKDKSNSDLTAPMTTKVQQEFVDARKDMKAIEGIYDDFDPEAFTYKGQAEQFLAEKLEKMGMASEDQKKLLFSREKQKQAIDRMMLIWRKYVTGVAGGEKEMAKIEATTLNPDQTPSQAKASIDTLYRRVLQTQEAAARLLSEGISLDKAGKGKYSALFQAEEKKVQQEHEAYIQKFLKVNPNASVADALRFRLHKARLAGE